MKRLPLGIQNFREIIEDGYVYADKTKHIYDLLTGVKHYFLSRPRRFGKSLLLDTIAEALSGNKELFEGLFIYDSGYSFEKHPVLRLDMSNIANETPEILKESLSRDLRRRIKEEGLEIDDGAPSSVFKDLIVALHNKYGKRVAVLIDEYDKPILDCLNNIETADANREILRGFYGVLKSLDGFLRLTFITGITKFTKTSIFSGLNNLSDITLSRKYANICGIPTQDLCRYFGEHIDNLASTAEYAACGSLTNDIFEWYDGYSWDGRTRVLNPFSLLSFLNEGRFSSFWYATGTPKYLTDLLKKRPEGYTDLSNIEMGEWALDTFDILNIAASSLLFQTGYLTVKQELPDCRPPVYLLDMPNHEVRYAFNLHIIAEFTEKEAPAAESAYRLMKNALSDGDLNSLLATLRSLFASIPFELHISREAYYHSIFFAIMSVLGFDIEAEASVSGGRIDAVLELSDKVYVIEFKYVKCEPDAKPEEKQKLFEMALEEGQRQISDRGYAKKYEGSGKKIIKAAFAFLGRDEIEMRVF